MTSETEAMEAKRLEIRETVHRLKGDPDLLAEEMWELLSRPTPSVPADGLVEASAATRNAIAAAIRAAQQVAGKAWPKSEAYNDAMAVAEKIASISATPDQADSGLAGELEALSEKAFSPNKRDWYLPWRVVPESGKPTIAGSHSGNLFRGFIGTWQDADLVVALVNNLPAILSALRSTPAPDALRDAEQIILALLLREAERAVNSGDCNCIGLSRKGEREYETGCCPHQRGRAFLAKQGVLESDLPSAIRTALSSDGGSDG